MTIGTPYSLSAVRAVALHAQGLAAASQTAKDIFPEDSAVGETEAKQEIWDNPEQFQEAVNKFETAAANFQQAVEGGDQAQIGPALKELGGSCKNCHDDFRQKKE